MDDLISRQAAIDKFKSIITDKEHTSITDEAKHKVAKTLFADIPSADVIEVVRCKDCMHNYRRTTFNHGKRDNPACKYINYVRDNDFYCKYGERAEE